MDATSVTLDQTNLDRLSDKDKAELRQFIANEQQRTRVQSRAFFFFSFFFLDDFFFILAPTNYGSC